MVKVETVRGMGGWIACALFGVKDGERTLLHHAIYDPAECLESCTAHAGQNIAGPDQTVWFPAGMRCPAAHFEDQGY